jgi:hypothetical protein
MEQDHSCRITMLDAYPEANAGRFGRLTQLADEGYALSRTPSECPVPRYCMHHGEFCVTSPAEGKRVFERSARGL